jgi:hypothetical protein
MSTMISSQNTLFSFAEIPLPPKEESALAAKAMLCKLSIGQWDGYKYDRKVSEEIADLHNAEKDSGRFRKRLLPRKALGAITRAIGAARRQHTFYTLPWGDDDYRILPASIYLDHRNALNEVRASFFAAVSALERDFERLVIDQNGLGTMFEINDYPGMRNEGGDLRFRFPEELRERFSFETKVLPMAAGDDFRANVSDEERERIRRQIAESVRAALRLGTSEIWQRLYKPVAHMARCMNEFNAAGKDNKPKLYDSMIENIVTVLDVLPQLNLEGDSSLERMAEEIRGELIVERKELRKSPNLSLHTGNKAAEISRRMAAYLGVPDDGTPSSASVS